jgi:hypothetical protein
MLYSHRGRTEPYQDLTNERFITPPTSSSLVKPQLSTAKAFTPTSFAPFPFPSVVTT